MNSVLKIILILIFLLPTMISSLVWTGFNVFGLWGLKKINSNILDNNNKNSYTPLIISLLTSLLLLIGSIYGTILISNA